MPDNMIKIEETDEEIRARRRKRIEEMKREKQRQEELRKKLIPLILGGAGLFVLLVLVIIIVSVTGSHRKKNAATNTTVESQVIVSEPVSIPVEPSIMPEPEPVAPPYIPFNAVSTGSTAGFPAGITSSHGVLIDVENKTILAEKGCHDRISPASMTKILTVLTAARALGIEGEDYESLPVMQRTQEITRDITDYSFVNDCSNVGFDVGEQVAVKELFYGTVLPSGADAAVGLACLVSGSHEAFVDLMNEELKRMGLDGSTHFTNCVGLYDKDHYSTAYDIGVMLKEAMDIPICRDVLSAHTYTIPASERHPDGIVMSNLFLRRIEDRDTHGEVIGAKTGYVVQSKNCAASLAKDHSGKEYICVTVGGEGKWKCIQDQTLLYQTWLPEAAQ